MTALDTLRFNHRFARAASGATVALSALWAGFVVFGPVSDARAIHLAGTAPAPLAAGADAQQGAERTAQRDERRAERDARRRQAKDAAAAKKAERAARRAALRVVALLRGAVLV